MQYFAYFKNSSNLFSFWVDMSSCSSAQANGAKVDPTWAFGMSADSPTHTHTHTHTEAVMVATLAGKLVGKRFWMRSQGNFGRDRDFGNPSARQEYSLHRSSCIMALLPSYSSHRLVRLQHTFFKAFQGDVHYFFQYEISEKVKNSVI